MTITNDQIACGTTTTGTGTLTLAAPPTGINAADPYAAYSGSGFGTSTGVPIAYSIVEYTDSTFTLPKQSESGVGTLLIGANLTATTLARTTVIQTVTSMDSQPATVVGQTATPSAITIGTTANVVIWFGDLSWLQIETMHYYTTGSLSGGELLGFTPLQITTSSGSNFTLVNQSLNYQCMFIPFSGIIKSATVWGQASYAGGTASLKLGLYDVGSDGRPGKKLIDFGSQSSLTAAAQTLSSTTGVFIRAGFYFFAMLAQFTGGAGTPTLRMANSCCPSMYGTSVANEIGPLNCATVASQTTLSDPATLTSLTLRTNVTNEFACAFKST